MIQQLRRTWIICFILVLAIILPVVRTQAQDKQPPRQLEMGTPIERELTGGESHSYQITLTANRYARVVVDQRGIDLVVNLFGPGGKRIAIYDGAIGPKGQENVSWVAEVTGNYRIDLAMKQHKATGRYEIRLIDLRNATDNDHTLYEANKLFLEYIKLGQAGEFSDACSALERVVALREKALGADHPDVAEALNALATIYTLIGNDAGTQAERLFKRAVSIWERAFGPEYPAIAQPLNNLAVIYKTRGDYAQAESFLQRALAIDMKVSGLEHPDIAQDYNNLGAVYEERGDYVKAESLYKQAQAIWEKALGPEHPALSQALNNLAVIYETKHDYAQVESLRKRALAIIEKAAGPNHPLVADLLIPLANVYRDSGDYVNAEPLYERALAIREKAFGPNHQMVAIGLGNLAILFRKMGDYAKAEKLNKRTLTITENTLGPDHPYTAETLHEIALLYSAKGDIGQAIVTLSRANEIDEHNFRSYLDLGSERQKIAFLETYSKWTQFALSLQSQYAPNDPEALKLAFTTILQRKARALDAMTDTIANVRRNATPEDQKLFDSLKETRSQLAKLILADPGGINVDTYQKRVKELKDKVDDLEGEISKRSESYRKQSQQQNQPVTLSAVQAALPARSALIEFVYFTPIDPKTEKNGLPRYLAYLLAPQGQPKWVDLGEAAPIDQSIDAWRKALRNPYRSDVTRLARTLDEKVMRPVRALLSAMQADTQHLMIAPDGSLNLIPFTALVDENDKYLIERYCISYLTSGRDLLRLQTSQPSRNAPLLIANPDFGRITMLAMRGVRRRKQSLSNPSQVYFPPLPATDDEAQAIKALFPKASLLTQDDATETAVKQSHGPQILHIATHGFFIDYQQPQSIKQRPNNNNNDSSPNNFNAPGINELASAQLASAQSTPYTVQLKASPAFEIAQENVRQLKRKGVDAYIIKSQVKGKGTFYRVRAGNFPTMNDAQKFGADLQVRGVAGEFFVTRYEQPQPEIGDPAPLVASTDANPLENRSADLRLSRMAANIENPLLRSGLALAGANQGKSGDDDGILTALEVADLDLAGTKLVVLSACDTGVGEVKNGEGVQGLRRALVLAGSESQVMSLWPVSDEATKDLMIPYYKALQHGEGRSEGLRDVQLRILHGRKDRQHPFYWAAFIQSGEWANLTGNR